jgi:replicative superfamily II helicase
LKLFRIESLTYTQKAAWLAVDHLLNLGSNKVSMKFETGAGKTTLGLLFLLHHSSNKMKSFYVNCSVDLCFRDYNKIAPIA